MKCDCCGAEIETGNLYYGTCPECGALQTYKWIFRPLAEVLVGIAKPMVANCAPENAQYFDLMFKDDENGPIQRVHGWMNRNTRRVHQIG